MFKMRLSIAAAAIAASAALAGPAGAAGLTDTQQVTAIAGNTLAVGVATPIVAMTNFGPNSTASGSGAVAVTATTGWTLSVKDATNQGTLVKSATPVSGLTCPATSEAATQNALTLASVTAPVGSLLATTHPGTLGSLGTGASVQVATGALTDTVLPNYTLVVGNEPLSAGCQYGTTLTYTVS
jgi:hypothetical protein